MSQKLIEAIRELNLKPGESYTVEFDGREVEVHDKEPSTLIPDGYGMYYAPPTPDPKPLFTATVPMTPLDLAPYPFDDTDLAPGFYGDDE